MTSFAFILGVLPLAVARGPGAEMRQALGTTVFTGMLGVTMLGLLLTPVFYVVLRRFASDRKSQKSAGDLHLHIPVSTEPDAGQTTP
jgi:HAE1 family hydrophobic/amphiphilic exporter-1